MLKSEVEDALKEAELTNTELCQQIAELEEKIMELKAKTPERETKVIFPPENKSDKTASEHIAAALNTAPSKRAVNLLNRAKRAL
jgi:phage shock protein A